MEAGTGQLDIGAVLLYKGRRCSVVVEVDPKAQRGAVEAGDSRLAVTLPAEDGELLRSTLQRFLTRDCRNVLLKRIAFYQPHFKVKPSQVEVKDMASKWGQCSSDRRLVFNWKLIMAPPEVLDYVVVHEMCHLVHLNHDRSFWRLVGRILPDHEACSAWLDRYGHHMEF